jgi:hypothetical protein
MERSFSSFPHSSHNSGNRQTLPRAASSATDYQQSRTKRNFAPILIQAVERSVRCLVWLSRSGEFFLDTTRMKAIARPARPRTEGWQTSRIGPPNASSSSAAVLRGKRLLPAADAVEIVRALPHGHVLAAVTTARRIDLAALLPRRMPQRGRDLAVGLIIARMLDPAAKLATARMLDPTTASHSLSEALGLGGIHRDHTGATASEERCPAAL